MENADTLKSSKILLCVSLEGEPGPAPRLHLCFLAALSLSLHPIPSRTATVLEYALWNSRKVMEAGTKKQGTERLSYPEAHRALLSFKSVCVHLDLEFCFPGV